MRAMLRTPLTLLCAFLVTLVMVGTSNADSPRPRVLLETSLGDITLELFPDKAPITVNNFLAYVNAGFYDGTIFHRVVHNFMVQGGGFTPDLRQKDTAEPILNESSHRLSNDRWTVAMARTDDPHSATSQFFINVRINPGLNFLRGEFGYTVFGEVIEGQHVVRDISLVPVRAYGEHEHLPVEPVLIERARLLQ